MAPPEIMTSPSGHSPAGPGLFWRRRGSGTGQTGPGSAAQDARGLLLVLVALLGAGFVPAQAWQQPVLAGFALCAGFGAIVLHARERRVLGLTAALALSAIVLVMLALRLAPPFTPLAPGGIGRVALGAGFGIGALALGNRLAMLGTPRPETGRPAGFVAFALGWQAVAAMAVAALATEVIALGSRIGASGLLHAELIALSIVTARSFACYALAHPPHGRRAGPVLLAAGGFGLFALLPAAMGPAGASAGAGPAVVTLIATSAMLLLVGVLRTARAAAACAAASCAALGAMTAQLAGMDGTVSGTAVTLALIMALVALNRFAQWGIGDGPAASDAGQRFQSREGRWLVELDLERRLASLPLSRGAGMRDIPFASLFAQAEIAPLMELFRRLGAPAAPDTAPDTAPDRPGEPLTLLLPGEPPTPMHVHVLAREDGRVWLSLAREGADPCLAARLKECEASLIEARGREEHLLAVASHELRTPVAILAMLVEDMKAGSSWDEIGISMDSTVRRLSGIMENLRAQTDGQSRGEIFTLSEIGFQILETFGSSAGDMRLRLDQSQDAETLLQGAPVRIVIALSKLVHNALVHSRGTEVTLSSFLTPGESEAAPATVTWMVRDDGIGIAPGQRALLFDAFRAAGNEGTGDATPGLGLYYARKSIGMIGGKLWLDEKVSPGACFVMTHPVRLLRETPQSTAPRQETMAQDGIPYASKSALLVEDNKLVGELTANRLRKLFGTVSWVETGPDALADFRRAPSAILFVDQLLPGMTGSELVAEVRRLDPAVPIVGITASTLGSECERLEAAGANLAVEKPLSFEQTRQIVRQFLGDGD